MIDEPSSARCELDMESSDGCDVGSFAYIVSLLLSNTELTVDQPKKNEKERLWTIIIPILAKMSSPQKV